MTLRFVAVVGIFGLVISPIASGVQRYLRGPKIGRGLVSTVAFGAAYAMASLTCSIAPFLALVVDSFRASSILGGMALFIAYTLGIGLRVGTAAVAVALALE